MDINLFRFSLSLFSNQPATKLTEQNRTEHVLSLSLSSFPTATMAKASSSSSSSSQKNRCTATTLLFLALFLLSMFLFSRTALDPALSLYTDLFLQPNPSSPLPSLSSPPLHSTASALHSSTNHSLSLDAPTEPIEVIEPQRISFNDEIHPVSNNESAAETVDDDNGRDPALNQQFECDLYMGTWVKDENYPIYQPGSCPYVDEAYDCKINGRTDTEYTKWRWKPNGCDLPRFSATDFLVRLRGKRLMLVGDSMNRNQFESILCILREGLHNKSKMYETHGHKITKGRGYFVFKFEDYNCTVEFVRSHFLVKEGVRINGKGSSNPTLSIDRIDKTSGRWKKANILVFNTGHWWTHGKTARGINYYKEGDYLYPKFDAVEAYRKAIKTWANWIDNNINPQKQTVYYRGYSSAHFRGGDWDSGGSCNGETEPVFNGSILNNYPLKMKIVEEVIKGMKVPVKLLNVTRLTNFRKDGHPSVYGKNPMGGKKVSTRRQDCSHWCLPGVPDAWNELIYATLVFQQTNSRG